jgi:flavin reductase (DIM6/NTAB) family NADH-FMN oxidoreductase RutF
MAGEPRLVGPYPEGADPETYDRLRRRVLWSMPSGLYVLGSAGRDRRNLMTLNWATQVATDPKLVAVSVEVGAVTHALINEGGRFALNVLARDDRAVVRKFVKPLVDDGDPARLGGFTVRTASTGAPILDLAAAWVDCRIVSELACGSHTLFVGEVVDCGGTVDEGLEVLRMEDTRMSYGG